MCEATVRTGISPPLPHPPTHPPSVSGGIYQFTLDWIHLFVIRLFFQNWVAKIWNFRKIANFCDRVNPLSTSQTISLNLANSFISAPPPPPPLSQRRSQTDSSSPFPQPDHEQLHLLSPTSLTNTITPPPPPPPPTPRMNKQLHLLSPTPLTNSVNPHPKPSSTFIPSFISTERPPPPIPRPLPHTPPSPHSQTDKMTYHERHRSHFYFRSLVLSVSVSVGTDLDPSSLVSVGLPCTSSPLTNSISPPSPPPTRLLPPPPLPPLHVSLKVCLCPSISSCNSISPSLSQHPPPPPSLPRQSPPQMYWFLFLSVSVCQSQSLLGVSRWRRGARRYAETRN